MGRTGTEIRKEFFEDLDGEHFVYSAFNNIQDIYFFVKNVDGRLVALNKALVEKLGFEREDEIVGKTDYDICPKNLADNYYKDDQHILQTGEPLVNKVELIPNSKFSVDWNITTKFPLYSKSGKVIGLAGITRDYKEASGAYQPYPEISVVTQHIQSNYHRTISIHELAQLVHTSVSSFERKFKKVFKLTPLKYIKGVRINEACKMLGNTHEPISKIAQDTGFSDQSYFTKEFIKFMKMTPSEYRKKFSRLGD